MLHNFENGGSSDDDEEQVEEEEEEAEEVLTDVKQASDDEDESGEEYEDDEDVKTEEHPLLKSLLETGKIDVPKQTKVPKVTNGTKENRPSIQKMVFGAINDLNERSGSSIQAIKGYITTNYPRSDANRDWLFIKKCIKRGVENGQLLQVKGTGARGSFKLASTVEKENAVKKKQRQEKSKLRAQLKRKEGVPKKEPTKADKTTDDSKQKKPKTVDKPPKPDAITPPIVAAKAELKAKQAPKKPMKTTATEDAAPEKEPVPAKKGKEPSKTTTGAKAGKGKNLKPAHKPITVNIIKQPARSKATATAAALDNGEGRASKRGAQNSANHATTVQPEVVAKKPSGKAKKK